MSENIVTTEQMEALKALSDVNIKISEAHNSLRKLQEDETEYLVLREKKAMDRIEKTIQDSQELLEQADKNYGEIKEIARLIHEFTQNLIKLSSDYRLLIAEFEARNTDWERNIGRQQDELAEKRQNLNALQTFLENDRKGLEIERAKLVEDQKKLNSDRGLLDRTIKRINKGNI